VKIQRAAAAGAALLLAFVRLERVRGERAMMPLALFGSRTFAGLSLLTFFLYGALGGLLVLLPYVLIVAAHYSGTEAGAALLPGRVSPLFSILYETVLGVAFIWQWPTLLALVSRVAPQRLKSTLMGAAFLTLFVSNTIIGRIGALYEHMSPAMFWTLNAAIAGTGAVLALLLRGRLGRVFEEEVDPLPPPCGEVEKSAA